jgi:predicted AlkP superfamily phosphohydrolase/phosphomutase
MTAFTGTPVGEHGWYSYWEVHSPGYEPRVLSSADARQPCLWNRPDFRDLRFAVINVCGTHPPTPVNGWLISYPMRKTLRATFPREFHHALARQGIRLIHDVAVWYSGQAREVFLSGALGADRARLEAALSCWRQRPSPDVLIINLTAIDRVSHFYWHELEPGSPIAEEETAIFQAFRNCDRTLERFLELLEDDVSLLVFSEIGFGPLRAYCSLDDCLAKDGFLTWDRAAEPRTILWRETVAFEAVQGCHGVNLNAAGRYSEGRVTAADHSRVRAEVIQALEAAINPYSGLALFRRVLPREEVYAGKALDQAPDIVLEPADERYQPLGDSLWARTVNRHLQSGWHRRDSFWAGIGPAFERGQPGGAATPLDVAPTICRMLGREPPAAFRGRPLSSRPGGPSGEPR